MALDMKWFDEMEAKIPKGGVRTRFAPSPTGYMHVGNLRTALYAYLLARRAGGTFILRIEDTDQGRLVDGAIDAVYATLKNCGLTHDEGPDLGGPAGPYIQTERRDLYARYAELLIDRGGAYRCFCGKEDAGEGFAKYDGRCSRLSQGEIEEKLAAGVPYVIRQKIPGEGATTFADAVFGEITTPNESLDDNVLIKSDGLPTYNFANVVDDHLMGITHVVRGSEYLSSTPKYNLLYACFGWEVPIYVHCAPVMRDAQNKMSKRFGDPSYEDLVQEGYLPEAVVNYVALLGWSPGGERELFTLDELAEVFDLRGISKSPAIFDKDKLRYFNSEYIRGMTLPAFEEIARPYIQMAVKNPDYSVSAIAGILKDRCEVLTDIPEKVDFFDALPDYDTALFVHKKSKTDKEISIDMLMQALLCFQGLEEWKTGFIHDGLTALAEELGVKNATVMWPVRIAVSGKAVTPGGAVEICAILGRGETLNRIGAALEKLSRG